MAPYIIGYVFDVLAGRFRGPGGLFVSFSTVRRTIDIALEGAAREAADIARQYTEGLISVPEFERQMQQLIKDSQIYSTVVAAGGYSSIGARELSLVQQRIAEQFAYLSNLADDLAAGKNISPAQLVNRSRMYAQSARNTYDVTFRAGQQLRGFTEERNIIHPGESCALCLAQKDKGWVPIGALIPVGQRTCLSNCNCTIDYRKRVA